MPTRYRIISQLYTGSRSYREGYKHSPHARFYIQRLTADGWKNVQRQPSRSKRWDARFDTFVDEEGARLQLQMIQLAENPRIILDTDPEGKRPTKAQKRHRAAQAKPVRAIRLPERDVRG